MSCDSILSCDEFNMMSPEQVLAMLTRKDSSGCAAINGVVVDSADPSELFVTCDNMNENGWRSLVYKMLTVDSSNNLALKIIISS